jgi:hypothetical protein
MNTIFDQKVTVFQNPDLKSSTIAELTSGTSVEVKKIVKKKGSFWLYIDLGDGTLGYILGSVNFISSGMKITFTQGKDGLKARYSFPPICPYCGKLTEKRMKTEVYYKSFKKINTAYRTTVDVPYCEKHMEIVKKCKRTKMWYQILSFVATVLLVTVLIALFFRYLEPTIQTGTLIGTSFAVAIFATLIPWGLIVRPIFKFIPKGIIKNINPSFRYDTNFLGFYAGISDYDDVLLSFYFDYDKVIEQFKIANQNNPSFSFNNARPSKFTGVK